MSSGVSYVPISTPLEVIQEGLDSYALNNLEDADPMYIGKASSSGAWLIQKFGKTSGIMTYANLSNNAGTTTYASAWSARVALTYGAFQTLTGV